MFISFLNKLNSDVGFPKYQSLNLSEFRIQSISQQRSKILTIDDFANVIRIISSAFMKFQ